MSCVPSDPRFRLLDHLVGWDEASVEGLVGLYDGLGMRLRGHNGGPGLADIDPFIPPPRLARGCGPCDWFLVTPPAPESRLLSLDGCDDDWDRVGPGNCFPLALKDATALAYDRRMLAIASTAQNRVWLLRAPGWQSLGEIEIEAPVAIALSGERLAIAANGGSQLVIASRNARILGTWPTALPEGRIVRVAYDMQALLWIVVERSDGRVGLYHQAAKDDPAWVEASLEELALAFEPTGLSSDDCGFCLLRGGADGQLTTVCYDWFGRTRSESSPGPAVASGGAFERQGQFLSGPIDSGEPRCRWHRVQIDADIPENTRIEFALSSSDVEFPEKQGLADGIWAGFERGFPHPADWQVLPSGSLDAMVQQPPGRFLFIRIRLTGDGKSTPVIRQVRLDFPRATGADLLPAIYREDASASDFTERFVSLFDATLGELETAHKRFPALLDPSQAPEEVLPWLAGLLDLSFDDRWDEDAKRRIIAHAPELFRKRGTRGGLMLAIKLVYGDDVEPLIEELGLARAWGAISDPTGSVPSGARLGQTRLYSRQRARVVLDGSPIGITPIKSYGDPATDAHSEGAFQFSVALPAETEQDASALLRLVDSIKPGHTLADVRSASGTGFHLGTGLRLGIDTLIRRPSLHPLNASSLLLGRNSVLDGTPAPGARLGITALTSSSPTSSCCTES